jgi:tetratricopeptide (TPR) repeat protein
LVRASAVALLERFAGPAARGALESAADDREPLVRWAAARTLDPSTSGPERDGLLSRLDDPVRSVRMEAARRLAAIDPSALTADQRESLSRALDEYLAGQLANNDQAGAHLNRGVVLADLGRLEEAEAAYRTGLRVDPEFVPVRFNLAMLYNRQGRNADAERMLSEAVAIAPDMAEAHYSLGLLLAEDESRLDDSLRSLAEAAKLAPEHARIQYNYGLALERLNRPEEAEKALVAACRLAPESFDVLYATAIFYANGRNEAEARYWAERLLAVAPNDPQVVNLWLRLRQTAGGK